MNVQPHDQLIPIGAEPMTVIWRSWALRAVVTLDTADRTNWPEWYDWDEVEDNIRSGEWTHREGIPKVYPREEDIPPNHRVKRDESWAIVGPLALQPGIFMPGSRGPMITAAAAAHGKSAVTVREMLRRVFHGGMDANALIPAWANIGGRDVPRPAAEDAIKRGRKVDPGKYPGVNVTPAVRQMFLAYADLHEKDGKVDKRQAYEECMRDCFGEVVGVLDGNHPKHIPLPAYAEAGLPRYEQFLYWVNKDRDPIVALRKKLGERPWMLNNRPVLGDSTKEAWGPCSRFQIDATIIDVYIRSKRNRRRVVKRATLYVVIDVFSRMIVGFSLSLCPPSWINAMGAIANCVADKVEFCAKFGITITEDQWPCRHLCAIMEGDRGEMEKAGVVGLIKRFGVTVENAAAYRADWKGIVESRFRLLQAQFRPYVPGYVEADFGERGGRDYRLDAALDLDSLTKVVIHQILAHNNDTVVGGYPMHPGMVEDGVPAVPRELWNWGIPRASGMPRRQDEAVVRFALMHRREAVVRRNGIYHQGALYTCRKAIEEHWFEKARMGKRFKVWISFDDRDTNVIYVHDPKSEKGYQIATLTPASAHRADMSFWDLSDTLKQEAVIVDRQRVDGVMGRAGHDAATDAICNEAVESLKDVDLGSGRSQITGIRDATTAERELDAVEEAAEYHAPMRAPVVPDDVIDGASAGVEMEAPEASPGASSEHGSDAPHTLPITPGYARPGMRSRRSRKENGNG